MGNVVSNNNNNGVIIGGDQKAQYFLNAMSSYKNGYYRESIEYLEKAVNTAKLEEGSLKSHNGITCLAWLGLSYFMNNEQEKAMEVFDKCNSLEEQGFGLTSDYAQTLAIIGNALVQAGQHERALSVYEHCKALHSQLGTCETPAYAAILTHYGIALTKAGYHARACALLKQSLEFKERIGGSGTKDYAVTMAHLAAAYDQAREFDMSVQMYEKVQMLYVRLKLSGTETHAVVLNALGAELIKVGEYKRATVVLEQAKSILEKLGMRSSLEFSDIGKNLEDAQQKALQPPEELTKAPTTTTTRDEDVVLELPRTSSSSSSSRKTGGGGGGGEEKDRGVDDEEAKKKRAVKKEAKKKSKERSKEHADRMEREASERKWRREAAKEEAERKAAEEGEKSALTEDQKRERATRGPSQPSPSVSPRQHASSGDAVADVPTRSGQLVSFFDTPITPTTANPPSAAKSDSILNWLELPAISLPFSSSSSASPVVATGATTTTTTTAISTTSPGPTVESMSTSITALQAHTLRLKPDQDVYESIIGFVKDRNIEAGCILSAVGSITQGKLRFAGRPEWSELSGSPSWEIVSMTGTVSINGSHIHASFSDQNGLTLGGHLVPGCKVHTTCELVILQLPSNIVYHRQILPNDSGYEELVVISNK